MLRPGLLLRIGLFSIPAVRIFQLTMKLSARNVLKGKVAKVTPGAVNSEVVVVLPNGTEIVSVITKSSAKSLGLKKGKAVYAVIKASSVMIAVD
jgi:molybdopterin-binding protein